MKFYKILIHLDHAGMMASTICAIHCALIPFLISTLPLWGIAFLAEPWIELLMISISLILGFVSLGFSYRRNHKKSLPLFTLLTGFLVILAGHFSTADLEPLILPSGGFCIAAAHYLNWKYTRICKNDHSSIS